MARSYTIRRSVQFVAQCVILVIGKIILSPFTRVDTRGVNHQLFHKRPWLIVANHRRGIDPFVIICCLPFKMALRLLPVSFMTKNIFYDSPLWPLIWMGGGFAARNPRGWHKLYGVNGSVKLLQHKFGVVIFPEGTRVYHAARGTAHTGIVRIHKAAPDVPFLLCHIEYHPGLGAWLTGRRRTVVYKTVGRPLYEEAEAVMDDIFSL